MSKRQGNVSLRLKRKPNDAIEVSVIYRGKEGRKNLVRPVIVQKGREDTATAIASIFNEGLSKVRAPRRVKGAR